MWASILKTDVTDETDFFVCGAGSMHVVQLVEEVKERAEVAMANEDVFMNTTFGDFINAVFTVSRKPLGSRLSKDQSPA